MPLTACRYLTQEPRLRGVSTTTPPSRVVNGVGKSRGPAGRGLNLLSPLPVSLKDTLLIRNDGEVCPDLKDRNGNTSQDRNADCEILLLDELGAMVSLGVFFMLTFFIVHSALDRDATG